MSTFLAWTAGAYVVVWAIAAALFHGANRMYEEEGKPPASLWVAVFTGLAWPVVLAQLVWLLCQAFWADRRP